VGSRPASSSYLVTQLLCQQGCCSGGHAGEGEAAQGGGEWSSSMASLSRQPIHRKFPTAVFIR
jgi:hypothetical protein